MKFDELSQEALQVQAHLGSVFQGYKYRTTRKIAREVLLYGNYFYNGRLLAPRAKSVGCGIYEVSVETA